MDPARCDVNAFRPIACDRVRLRALRHADLAAFAAYRNDPAVARYQSWSAYTLEDAQALLTEMAGKAPWLPGEWYQIALADKFSDALLGDLALHVIDPAHVEVGFTLAPAAQGRGYAREGLEALLRFVFSRPGIETALAVTDARNTPAIRLLEHVGFAQSARPRRARFKGETVEEFDFEYTAAEWRRRHG